MRLISLRLPSFKNLQDFSINFDGEADTTVLVGRNGTGKSNLLEALSVIFGDLDLGATPSFPYEMVYYCRDKRIEVVADPLRERQRVRVKVKVDGEDVPFSTFFQDPDRQFLPSYVFGYYSGFGNRMEDHFSRHQRRFYDDLIHGRDRPLRPMLYARPVHSQFVLLAFFVERDEQALELLKGYLGIEALESVLFIMRQPPWRPTLPGDPRFWNARGTVSSFLGELYRPALAPLRLERRVEI
ncbi:MAG TPA: AAA family ATPase, partial [Candidatus Bathyarchaeia archaeon]